MHIKVRVKIKIRYS